jgi:hypothetical protein
MTKIEICSKGINAKFRDKLRAKIKEKFGIDIKTEWNFISGALVTSRKNGKDFTRTQLDFIEAYSDGYEDAMNQVTEYK